MYRVMLDTRNGEFVIVHKDFNYPSYLIPQYGPASKPACKAWIAGHRVGLSAQK